MTLRTLFLATAFTLTAPVASFAQDKPAVTKKPAARDEFPLPKDATAPKAAPGGAGKIESYEVPRAKDAVLAELREALKKAGWLISKEEASPRGTVRLEVKKGDRVVKVSVLGDATKTALILTHM